MYNSKIGHHHLESQFHRGGNIAQRTAVIHKVLGNPLFYSKTNFWCIFILSRKVNACDGLGKIFWKNFEFLKINHTESELILNYNLLLFNTFPISHKRAMVGIWFFKYTCITVKKKKRHLPLLCYWNVYHEIPSLQPVSMIKISVILNQGFTRYLS